MASRRLLWDHVGGFSVLVDHGCFFSVVPTTILLYTGLLITLCRGGGGFEKRASGSSQSILFEPTACQNLDFDFESIL